MKNRLLAKTVATWLRQRNGECFCDPCIARELAHQDPKSIRCIARRLGNEEETEFARYPARCAACGDAAVVTMASAKLVWA